MTIVGFSLFKTVQIGPEGICLVGSEVEVRHSSCIHLRQQMFEKVFELFSGKLLTYPYELGGERSSARVQNKSIALWRRLSAANG